MVAAPRSAVMIDQVLPDRGLIRALVEANGPYYPTQRYFTNEAEYEALSGQDGVEQMPIPPLFRGNWLTHEERVDGLDAIVRHEGFTAAAKEIFGGTIVRPQNVYANLTWQIPFAQGAGHTDIPAFLGFDRTEHPITFLSIMGHSRLFEAERLKIATAVSWFYLGGDGGFEYWPDGPDGPSVIHEGAIDNTALIADNDVMYHRARAVGRVDDGIVMDLTRDATLERRGGDTWGVRDGDRDVAEFTYDDLRISVSWKALVFETAADEARYDQGNDGLTIDEVVRRFSEDLVARGLDVPDLSADDDPTSNAEFVRLLQQTYIREPEAALL